MFKTSADTHINFNLIIASVSLHGRRVEKWCYPDTHINPASSTEVIKLEGRSSLAHSAHKRINTPSPRGNHFRVSAALYSPHLRKWPCYIVLHIYKCFGPFLIADGFNCSACDHCNLPNKGIAIRVGTLNVHLLLHTRPGCTLSPIKKCHRRCNHHHL